MQCARCKSELIEQEWLWSADTENMCLTCWNKTHCSSCGTYVKDGWNYCPMCGSSARYIKDREQFKFIAEIRNITDVKN